MKKKGYPRRHIYFVYSPTFDAASLSRACSLCAVYWPVIDDRESRRRYAAATQNQTKRDQPFVQLLFYIITQPFMFLWMASRLRSINAQIRVNSSLFNAPPTDFYVHPCSTTTSTQRSLTAQSNEKNLRKKTWNVYYTRMRKGGSGSIAGPDRHLLQEPRSRWHPTIHHPSVPLKIVRRGRWWTQGEYDAVAAGQIHRGVVKMEGFLVPRFQRCASIDRHGSTARGVIVGPRAGSRESSRPRRAHDQHHCDEWDTSS